MSLSSHGMYCCVAVLLCRVTSTRVRASKLLLDDDDDDDEDVDDAYTDAYADADADAFFWK